MSPTRETIWIIERGRRARGGRRTTRPARPGRTGRSAARPDQRDVGERPRSRPDRRQPRRQHGDRGAARASSPHGRLPRSKVIGPAKARKPPIAIASMIRGRDRRPATAAADGQQAAAGGPESPSMIGDRNTNHANPSDQMRPSTSPSRRSSPTARRTRRGGDQQREETRTRAGSRRRIPFPIQEQEDHPDDRRGTSGDDPAGRRRRRPRGRGSAALFATLTKPLRA